MVAEEVEATSSSYERGKRGVSEFLAVLMIVIASIVASILFILFFNSLMTYSSPSLGLIESSVVDLEVLHSGAPTTVQVGTTSFTANHIYRVEVMIHNVGNQQISNMYFQTVTVKTQPQLTVCTSNSCDVYDPVVFASTYTNLPNSLGPNQVVKVSFIVLSKADLISTSQFPFVIKITGVTPNGRTVVTYINIGWR